MLWVTCAKCLITVPGSFHQSVSGDFIISSSQWFSLLCAWIKVETDNTPPSEVFYSTWWFPQQSFPQLAELLGPFTLHGAHFVPVSRGDHSPLWPLQLAEHQWNTKASLTHQMWDSHSSQMHRASAWQSLERRIEKRIPMCTFDFCSIVCCL